LRTGGSESEMIGINLLVTPVSRLKAGALTGVLEFAVLEVPYTTIQSSRR